MQQQNTITHYTIIIEKQIRYTATNNNQHSTTHSCPGTGIYLRLLVVTDSLLFKPIASTDRNYAFKSKLSICTHSKCKELINGQRKT